MTRAKILIAVAIVALGAISLASYKDLSFMTAKASPTYDLSADSNKKFLADNAAKSGVVVRPSGLQYRVIHAGSGKTVKSAGDMVTVTYRGWLISGKVFDQTQAGQTATFPAGRLIPGWVEALSLMKEGDEWELVIPAKIGYGARGAGDVIPANQTLVFDMTLISVAPAQ
ncbi:MAG: FKBP-type peptidyl-prolyl cis-trans isomerase [Rhizomicrobium sp.]|jgi:FKBP-type peptidyl-prolyl cis-trans isomerase